MKKCPYCGAQIADDSLFCTECGKEQPKGNTCPHCGTMVNEGDVFCTECGKKIGEEEEQSSMDEVVQVEEPKPIQQEASPIEEVEDNVISEEYKEEPNFIKKYLPFVIGGIVVLALIIGFFVLNNSNNEPKKQQIKAVDSVMTDSNTADSKDAKVFLEGMYKDLYEPWNTNRFDETTLSKYFTAEAMKKFYVESDYEEGEFSYSTDFLVNGSLREPDYGDKVVSRSIEPESDGWFLVTNTWDVVKEPVRVHLKVKSVDGTIKIVDIKIEDDE